LSILSKLKRFLEFSKVSIPGALSWISRLRLKASLNFPHAHARCGSWLSAALGSKLIHSALVGALDCPVMLPISVLLMAHFLLAKSKYTSSYPSPQVWIAINSGFLVPTFQNGQGLSYRYFFSARREQTGNTCTGHCCTGLEPVMTPHVRLFVACVGSIERCTIG